LEYQYIMSFADFRESVHQQVLGLVRQETLYVTDIDKDKLYELYLSSFPAGTNNLYLERAEHDCSACKQFIRTFGGVVAIINNELVSVWDINRLDSTYEPVAAALSAYVKSMPVVNQFMHDQAKIGIASNVAQLNNGDVHTWYHIHANLPSRFIVPRGTSVGAAIGELRDRKNVFMRSLEELTIDSIETVLDLISQNSLYRGEESKALLQCFLTLQKVYADVYRRDEFCWDVASKESPSITKIRNSAIGTLLIDISEGVELDVAVRKFEAVVAPANYKRPKAVFSTRMLEEAQKTVIELGLLDSLPRRFATVEDIKVQNILFANTDIMRQVVSTDVFTQMKESIPANPKQFTGVEEVPIEKFLAEVLPRATSLEVLLENRHAGNLVSVIAPANATAPSMFKWGNAFCLAYSGNIADSMKQRVKGAGGSIDGVLRFSIQWNENGDNQNDFDAHCKEPDGNLIYFRNARVVQKSSGVLDVDIIHPNNNVAVENITYSDLSKMPEGFYSMEVNTYSSRGGLSGFRAEIEFDGEIHSFDYPKATRNKEKIEIAIVSYSKAKGFTIEQSLDSSVAISSKSLWGKQTNQFHPVTAMMLSPNYWDEMQGNGNKHFLFMLDGCINDEKPNGFFNEFLRNDLMPHKRVFEALGNKMQVTSDNPKQLSGVGFSSTQRNSVIVKVTGHAQRIVKVIF
jgi:hypothetical protein